MSALAAVFGPAAGSSGGAIRDMFAAMHRRASGVPDQVTSPGSIVAAARHDWETDDTIGGWSGPLIVSDEAWTVAADASLYYLADLRRRLPASPTSGNTGELLLLALRHWGPHFATSLEGDYAIVARERRTGRVLLARDFGGRRNLVYSLAGGSLVVASSPTALVRHPAVSAEYDETFIAIAAAGVFAHGPRTAYARVAAVPGGSTLAFDGRDVTQVARWMPPPFASGWEPALSPASAEELRALLVAATRERMAPNGLTSVWMSGGWDSTAVFAAGKSALARENAAGRRLLPISVSLPPDDWGFEDHHIRAVGEHWSTEIDWTGIDSIPLMADADTRARTRDDPMAQAFESMVRTLSNRSVKLGTRVALDGFGGDHLFLVSGAALVADHLFHGRWSNLRDVWRTWSGDSREFLRLALLPLLSAGTRRWIGSVRGRPLAGYLDRALPGWIRPTRPIEAELELEFERLPGEGAAEFESRYIVTNSIVPRSSSWNHAMALDEGVALRGPLFDQRVISFAARRPLSDRNSGGDSKRILRYAMKGLLPETVLAPRDRKTGTTVGYFRRQLQGSLESELVRLFGEGRSQLEHMGILNRQALLAAAERYTRTGAHEIGAILHFTLEAERWLDGHQGGGPD